MECTSRYNFNFHLYIVAGAKEHMVIRKICNETAAVPVASIMGIEEMLLYWLTRMNLTTVTNYEDGPGMFPEPSSCRRTDVPH